MHVLCLTVHAMRARLPPRQCAPRPRSTRTRGLATLMRSPRNRRAFNTRDPLADFEGPSGTTHLGLGHIPRSSPTWHHCSTPTRLERRPPQGGDNAGGVSLRPDYLLRDDTAVDDSTRGSYGHYLGRLTGPGWLMCPPFAPPPLGRFTGPRGHKDAPGSPARHCASYARWFIEVRPNQEHTAVRMPWLFAGGLPRRTGGSTHRPAD